MMAILVYIQNLLNAPTFQASHAELTWLNEREDRELTRDWADKNLKLAEVEQYYEVGLTLNCLSITFKTCDWP